MKKYNFWTSSPMTEDYSFKKKSNLASDFIGMFLARIMIGFMYATGVILAIKCFL